MLVTINVPDSLPQERLWQQIREIEENFRQEAEFIKRTGKMSDDGECEEDMRLFWESFGSWEDDRTTEEIIKDIYGARKTVERSIQL